MTIDYDKLKNWTFPVIEQTYTERDTMLYALGLGLGTDPLDENQLRFVYEKDLRALPTMAGVLGYPGFWLKDADLGLDWLKLVHGEQAMRLHRPLPIAGTVIGVNRVVAVVDKGAGRGALVVTERTVIEKHSGAVLATLQHTAFCRGDGGFSERGQASDKAPQPRPAVPDTPADVTLDLVTRPETALIYRLSADRNPLHAEPAVAKAAGYPRPILHGMGTFGVVGHAILKSCCAYDPARLRAISARFSSPVFPGETIRTEIWRGARDAQGQAFLFRARVAERGVVVLENGYAQVAEN